MTHKDCNGRLNRLDGSDCPNLVLCTSVNDVKLDEDENVLSGSGPVRAVDSR